MEKWYTFYFLKKPRDDWYIFRSIFVSFFYLLLFHNSDGVTGLFSLKHALGYNVYPAPPFSDCDHLFWMTTLQFSIAGFYPPVGDNLRNGFISMFVVFTAQQAIKCNVLNWITNFKNNSKMFIPKCRSVRNHCGSIVVGRQLPSMTTFYFWDRRRWRIDSKKFFFFG